MAPHEWQMDSPNVQGWESPLGLFGLKRYMLKL